jgi:hypothetical protein
MDTDPWIQFDTEKGFRLPRINDASPYRIFHVDGFSNAA